jgi:Cyclophilin type peptidyl-prolyl cis-trans isomerase/CLD
MPPTGFSRALRAGFLTALAGLLFAACGGEDGGDTTTLANLPEGCEEVQQPPAKRVDLKAPQRKVRPDQDLVAVVDTSCGRFEIALDARRSPKTVSSFVYLARRGVYDNTIFHGIDPKLVIQGGDPTGTGTGGPGYYVDEPPPSNTE